MSPGPLRRLAGTLGLAAMVPTGVLLAMGSITVADAAVRAAVTLVVVTVVGRVAGWWLSWMVLRFERRTALDGEGAITTPAGGSA